MQEDPAAEARKHEAAGDLLAAASAWRRHVERCPADLGAQLRLGLTLAAAGQHEHARRVLEQLESAPVDDSIAVALHAQLAELDELEGRGVDAALRWERTLAYDIDHARARSRLQALRPRPIQEPRSATETFALPEGAKALRFVLLRELGRGASSAVYLAQDRILQIPVALKILHPHLAGAVHEPARTRFFNEAKILAALRHPGVVAIYDIDEATRSLVMELIPGGTLRARLRAAAAELPGGRLPADEAMHTARGLLDALSYLHGRGIVHGDIKPGNLLLRRPGEPVLVDFGSARLRSTVDDEQGGTPLYLAPEQLRGAPSSETTDVFAAGAVIWEIVAGRPLRQQADLLADRRPSPAPPQLDGACPELQRLAALAMLLVTGAPDQRPTAAEALLQIP